MKKHEQKKNTILFVGLSKLFNGMRACDTRLKNISNLFIKLGWQVIILNRDHSMNLPLVNDGVKTVNVNKIPLNFYTELKYIFKIRKNISFFSLYTGHCFEIFFYYLIGKLFNIKTIYHYVELRSSFNTNSLYHKLNGMLFDYFFYKLADGYITISNSIDNKIKKINKPFINIPPLSDYPILITNSPYQFKYFAYCGSIDYKDEIEIVISAFLNLKEEFKLVLVLGGNQKIVNEFIKKYKEIDRIIFLSKISEDKLNSIYCNSIALLLPLNDTVQNKFRFPQKIAEYTSHSGYIITNEVGDITNFFTNNLNVIFCEYSIDGFTKALKHCINNENYDIIKINAFETYKKYFNIYSYSAKVNNFLKKII